MELFYILLVLLLTTRVFGEVAARFSQPVLVGELLAGVLLGVTVQSTGDFPVLADLDTNEVFTAITDLGIFFLMLLAGLEMRPRDLLETSGSALMVALGGILVPMALGLVVGYLALSPSGWKTAQMLYLGVALSVTAVPIAVATLMSLKKLGTRVGKTVVSAAVFDDLISLFLLAVLMSMLGETEFSLARLGALGGKVLVFFLVVMITGRYLFPVVGRFIRRLRIKHIEFSTLVGWALVFSVLAEKLDMHFILGAYAAGLFFTRQTVEPDIHERLYERVETVTLGFLAPVFFASIGLSIQLDAITEVPVMLTAYVIAAFVGKIVGSGAAALGTGMSRTEAMAVGMGMNARGVVSLVIADVALRAGLFDRPEPPPAEVAHLFSVVVIMSIVTAVLSPVGMRAALKRMDGGRG